MIKVDVWIDRTNQRWNCQVRGGSTTAHDEQIMRDMLVAAWNRDQGASLSEADFEFEQVE